MALLVEIANSCVSWVAAENNPFSRFVNWSTTGFCLIFTFHLSFWDRYVRLVNSLLKVKVGWKQVCFQNHILDDTLDNNTSDGDSDINDNNDDDNDNHDSDNNNDFK